MVLPQRSLVYKIEAISNKNKLFEVILNPKGFWIDGQCSCQYWLDTHRHCEHIKKAILCYRYGL